MTFLSTIHQDASSAEARTLGIAKDARALGFTDVEVHYEPETGLYTVTGDMPAVPAAPPASR